MAGIEIDTSEVRELAMDMRQVDARLARHLKPIVSKGALNIKNQLRKEMAGSQHFKGAASAISYDLLDGGFTAEIGPSSEGGSPGNLANIAYFGTSRGGGTVADPSGALDEEIPRFEQAILAEAEKLILG